MSEAGDLWRQFCRRMEAVGVEALADELVLDDRDRADGLRHLTRQMVFALQMAVEFGDLTAPAMYRYDDDVTKWGAPNADNNYVRCAIDPAGTYRLTADVRGVRQMIVTIGEGDMQLGRPGLTVERSLRELDTSDGRIEVTVGPDPAPGDWMPTSPESRLLSVRSYLADWANDTVPEIAVERLDVEPSTAPLDLPTVETRLDTAAHWVETSVPFWLDYVRGGQAVMGRNEMRPPTTPSGGATDIAYGAGIWELADDQAWIVEFELPDADHWSIQTQTSPWFESGELATHQTSLNDEQVHVDRDGRVRVVVAHRDPGVPNWLDTEGRSIGMVVYRWIWARTKPVPDCAVTTIDDVRSHVPADHPVTTPDDRRQQLDGRRRAVHHRFRR